jgi:hypothetical protein
MEIPHEREERIKLYARALGRSERDIEAQLARVAERQAMRAGESPGILQMAAEIADEHGMTTSDLLRRALQLSRRIPTHT